MLPPEFGDFMWLTHEDYIKLKRMDKQTSLRYISAEDYNNIMHELPVHKQIYYKLRNELRRKTV
jgi:hypothetical protein